MEDPKGESHSPWPMQGVRGDYDTRGGGWGCLSSLMLELNWVVHKLPLSPGISVVPLVSLTRNDENICKLIFENSMNGGGSEKS